MTSLRYPAALLFSLASLACQAQSWPNAQSRTPDLTEMPGSIMGDSPEHRVVFLNGRVTLEQGVSLNQQVVIQSSCGGGSRPIGYSDSRGYFNIQLALPDSTRSARGFSGEWSGMQDCELRAEAPGYLSSAVQVTIHPSDNATQNVGTLVLYRGMTRDGYTVSATSLTAPPKAQKDYQKARQDADKGKWSAAREKLMRAVQTYPRYALAWLELGRVQANEGDVQAARASFQQALAADSKFVMPYAELAKMAAKEQNWQQVAATTDRFLQLDPVDYPVMWYLNSAANYQMKNLDVAEKAALRGIHLDEKKQIPRMQYLLSAILVLKKDYHGAVQHLQEYLNLAPKGDDVTLAQQQLAVLEKLSVREGN